MSTTRHFEVASGDDLGAALHAVRRHATEGNLVRHAQAELRVAIANLVTALGLKGDRPIHVELRVDVEGEVQTLAVAVRVRPAPPTNPLAEAEMELIRSFVDVLTHEHTEHELSFEVGKVLPGTGGADPSAALFEDDQELRDGVGAELQSVVHALAARTSELSQLTGELAETNRGVLALYAELDEAARQWHTTFDAISAGVGVLDEKGRLARVNPALPHLLGCAAEHLIGREPGMVVTSCLGLSEVPAILRGLDGTPGRHAAEVHAGGSWFAIALDPVLGSGGEIRGGVLIIDEISERKRLEEEKQAAERAEREASRLRLHAGRMKELERVKTDFLNLASHELRGPLAVLRGYISMLEDGSLGELTPGMEQAMPVMVQKMREMNLLVNQMLETARIEDSRLVLDITPLDLVEVVAEAESMMEPLAALSHELVIEGADGPVPIHGDRNRLTTIVTNLIDNAIKYSPGGGVVRVRIETDLEAREARVSVADQGLGIADGDRGKLFTRFGRLVTQENSHIPGTGLGLYLARELARMHRGDIDMNSRRGEGSEFTLVLPLAPA